MQKLKFCPFNPIDFIDKIPELESLHEYHSRQYEYGCSTYEFINNHADEIAPIFKKWWDGLSADEQYKLVFTECNKAQANANKWQNYCNIITGLYNEH